MPNEKSFQVNLRGIIELLSGHLYSGPNVYIRELLQNCVDAISARRIAQSDLVGEVSLELISSNENNLPTLIVTDNGIGLNEDEVHQFLATIGQSSKRETMERDTFIGQFGIGLLSAFMVCNEIVLISKSAKGNSSPVKWTGYANGTYKVETLDFDMDPGSQVYLRCKPGCHEFFEFDFISHCASYYGEFLPESITVIEKENNVVINKEPPWTNLVVGSEPNVEQLLDWAKDEFEISFLDAIPIHSEIGDVNGIAFLMPSSQTSGSRRSDRVYLKGMLVSRAVDNLLPDWAFFVRCVLNAKDLSPTASREAFHDDQALSLARAELGAALRDWLVDLSKNNPEKLQAIISVHYRAMKALAVDDDEFFRLMIDWLPFETTLGHLTMGEIRAQKNEVRYVPNIDQFRQIAAVANSQEICLINAGYSFDQELIEKMPVFDRNISINAVDPSELAHEFGDLTLKEREQTTTFIRTADAVLQPFKCHAEIRKFKPVDVAALFTSNEQSSFFRSVEQTREVANDLFSGVLDGLSNNKGLSSWPQLCFNFANPLIQKMVKITDANLLQRSIELLYVQSLLQGHYPLKSNEQRVLNEGLLNIIDLCLEAGGGSPDG